MLFVSLSLAETPMTPSLHLVPIASLQESSQNACICLQGCKNILQMSNSGSSCFQTVGFLSVCLVPARILLMQCKHLNGKSNNAV